MKLLSALLLTVGLAASSFAKPQDAFPDIPDNHWVFESLSRLKRDGLTVGFPDGLGRFHPTGRYELALTIRTCYTNLQAVAKTLAKEAKTPSRLLPDPDAEKVTKVAESELEFAKQGIPVWEPSLTRLIKEFIPQLKAMGLEPDEMVNTLNSVCSEIRGCQTAKPGSSLAQFSDVPANHWAAKQVLELRRLGILEGYPATVTSSATFNRS